MRIHVQQQKLSVEASVKRIQRHVTLLNTTCAMFNEEARPIIHLDTTSFNIVGLNLLNTFGNPFDWSMLAKQIQQCCSKFWWKSNFAQHHTPSQSLLWKIGWDRIASREDLASPEALTTVRRITRTGYMISCYLIGSHKTKTLSRPRKD